jgi:phosphoglycerate kinase
VDWSNIPTINQLEDIAEKRVLMRLDLEICTDADKKDINIKRLDHILSSINYALARACRVILCSHFGQPNGKIRRDLSLEYVGLHLAELLDHEIQLTDYPIGDSANKLIRQMRTGDIVMLENLRFDRAENANNPAFAKQLASYAEIYINDAFCTIQHKYASTEGLLAYLQGACGIGFSMKRELDALSLLQRDASKPYISILGGKDIPIQLSLMRQLIKNCDAILLGGDLAYTFIGALGGEVGSYPLSKGYVGQAKQLIDQATRSHTRLCLPSDHLIAQDVHAENVTVSKANIPQDMLGFDIGPDTRSQYQQEIAMAQTIFWHGAMGRWKSAPFALGTRDLVRAIAKSNAHIVISGSDLEIAVQHFGLQDNIGHICTSTSSALAYLEDQPLPSLLALAQAPTQTAHCNQ